MPNRIEITMEKEEVNSEPYMSRVVAKDEDDKFKIVLQYADFFLVEKTKQADVEKAFIAAENEFYDIYGDEYYASVKDSIKLYQNGKLIHEVDGDTIIKWMRNGHGSTLFEQPHFLIFDFIMANFDYKEIVSGKNCFKRKYYEKSLKNVEDDAVLSTEKGA